jgi:aspartate carbamoyltransferase catalytic subunit
MNRHLISAGDLSRDDAILILDTAEELASVEGRPIRKLPTLRGLTVVNLFYEDSTRTRTSFEAAAKRLSADVINFSAKGSSVAKGESLKDTALTLEAMGADAVVIRHEASGAPRRLTNWVSGCVVNAGDGTHEHPTQALLDAFTMRQFFPGGATPRTPRCPPEAALIAKDAIVSGPPQADEGLRGAPGTANWGTGNPGNPRPGTANPGPGRPGSAHPGTSKRGSAGAVPDNRDDRRGKGLDGVRVTIVGDVLHSRVARSNVLLLSTLGAQVTVVAPPTLMPHAVETWPCRASYDLDAELRKSDVVMMLRVQQERMTAAYFPTVREYRRRYGLDAGRMALLPEHAIVMHPGPMNRGVEIAAEVADSDRSTIVAQVANGVTVRMAVLYLMLGGAAEVAP